MNAFLVQDTWMHAHALTHTDTHSEIGRANIIAPVL